ncbi:MAG: EVE domain-containing protein [Paraglaciecola sp.]|nr:EVE domain-containing protein [Paraglaciecola sp.]NCT46694.1 EVE domain-containing protein [Paraglaciecola sp.]
MQYWLFKTEPDAFGIDDLAARPHQTEHWDGIRNYQARNFLRDQVQLGDQVFIYHSSCKEAGIAGLAEIVRTAYPDHSQFDPESTYFDPKSEVQAPRWYMVDVKLKQKFNKVLLLSTIKSMPQLTELRLLKKGHRLSIMPVLPEEFLHLLQAAKT